MRWRVLLENCVFQSLKLKSCLSRKDYWQFSGLSLLPFVFIWILSSLGWPNQALAISPPLGLVFGLLFLSGTLRRLHDSGHSAWWCLIGPLTIIGLLPLFFFLVQKSRFVDNPYRKDTRQISPERRAVASVVSKKPQNQNKYLCA